LFSFYAKSRIIFKTAYKEEVIMSRFVMYVFGAVLGGLVGGSVGLLLAPKPGRALRDDISDYTQYVKKEVRQASNQRRVELEEELSRLREPEPMAK
jgi:hypothetical protein